MMNVPEEKYKLLEKGYMMIDEHPDGRWAMLAKAYVLNDNRYMEIAEIPKYGDKIRKTFITERDWRKLNDLWNG